MVADATAACDSPVSTSANDYVGQYVLRRYHGEIDGFADFLVLKSDHTASQIRVERTTGER
jgi:hypothetical protein